MDKVKIVEVSPRDGLQNEAALIDSATKIEFIHALSQTGLSTIEATSFVSENKIPQLADGEIVFASLIPSEQIHYPVLVPNLEGLERALAVGVKDISIFTAASDTFTQKNINCSIEDSFERIIELLPLAKEHNLGIRGYISCVLGCPYEGEIDLATVQSIAKRLFDLGCDEISLGDTIGVGTAKQSQALVKAVAEVVPVDALAVHFHDTYGQALANIVSVLDLGIRTIDASVAGLGGCPYAQGASGNVATEDVVYCLQGMGFETGVDLNQLIQAGRFICDVTGKETGSKVARALS